MLLATECEKHHTVNSSKMTNALASLDLPRSVDWVFLGTEGRFGVRTG